MQEEAAEKLDKLLRSIDVSDEFKKINRHIHEDAQAIKRNSSTNIQSNTSSEYSCDQ